MPIPESATPESIQHAARILRDGGLVAFPTETVYGLGANALDADAVERIYRAKGRPRSSPLIAHVDSIEQAQSLLAIWPEDAQRLADAFWPGPLTLVLPKAAHVPDALTGGLGWLGVRQPAHSVALELIRAVGQPLAAPSANPFMQLSPTTAEHVAHRMGDAVGMILDGGACAFGIESTVVRIKPGETQLLRPGAIPKLLIEQVLGHAVVDAQASTGDVHASPGQHPRHYAPRTPLMLWQSVQGLPPGRGAVLAIDTPSPARGCDFIRMPPGAEQYARQLYSELHRIDAAGYDWIAVQTPPGSPEWAAVHDRLQRAAHPG